MKTQGYFTFEGSLDGIIEIVGTDAVQFTQLLARAPQGRCFLSGTLVNQTPQEFRLKIMTEGFETVIYKVPEFGGITFKKHPMSEIRAAVNGTIRLQGVGFIVDEETASDRNLLLTAETIEVLSEIGRNKTYTIYDHTDISTATTTTCATPDTGKTIRLYKLTASAQGAARSVLQWTDSDGTTSPTTLGTLNYGAEGTFVYDFGDNGLHCPNGVGGLLRLVSNNTAVIDVDIVSRDD